ncbi:MAG: C39 family peptidase [Candidatus Shapirobacteria bacterium]
MKRRTVILLIAIWFIFGIAILAKLAWENQPRPALETKFIQKNPEQKEKTANIIPEVSVIAPGSSAILSSPYHIYQTFNNCGPATLSMILSWYDISASQEELGQKMRPFQNSQGDNDDKTIFATEFVYWAKQYGLQALERPNGDLNLLKKFIANNIPVVVKTWLNPNEDIGHFRLVRGFDENKKVIIQDDSYQGRDKEIPYYDFLSLWQPFNYNYILVYPLSEESKITAILDSEAKEKTAWENALSRAEKENKLDPENPYPVFNIATSAYHLGDYQKSVLAFEQVENKLPRRMLWYQIEPIIAYFYLENYDRVFEITNQILNNGNRAFSELYLIRAEIYEKLGNAEKAKEELELALKYNPNLPMLQFE